MGKSFKLFLEGLCKSIFFWISLIFILYPIIKEFLPQEYQRSLKLSHIWALIIFLFLIIIAGFTTYHKLRMVRLNEFYKFSPEANKDRIFRIFYELHKQGEFEKKANIERMQKWDEKVLLEIKKHCHKEFEWLYLDHTGRRSQEYTPITENYYDSALEKIKKLLDKDFDLFIKV